MNDFFYKWFKKNYKFNINLFYITFSLYIIGFLLFICSLEYIILHSLNKDGDFVWSNLNLIWIFGLIILVIAVCFNISLYLSTLKIEKAILKIGINEIKINNKYLLKWKQKIKNHLSTKYYFLNLFNIQIWFKSLKANFEYFQEHHVISKQENNNDKITSIFEEYHKQFQNDD